MEYRYTIVIILAVSLYGCTPFHAAKKNFLDGREMAMKENPYLVSTATLVKKENPAFGISRYVYHIGFIKKGTCKFYEDVDSASKKMIGWGYLGNPDFCIMPIDWSQFM